MFPRFACLTALLLLSATVAVAADWPQWRGPDRNGISLETGIRSKFDNEPKLLWTFDKGGNAYSGPAIVGTTLYSLGTRGGQDIAFAIDTESGTEKWHKDLGPAFKQGYGDGARCTPTIDADYMYLIRGGGELHCIKTKNGDPVWKKSFRSDFGGEIMSGWGYSESPLVDGDRVIVTPGGSKGALVALEKKSGKLIWRSTEWTHKATYSSPIVAEMDGVRMYIQVTALGGGGPAAVIGVAADTGKLLWSAERGGATAVIPTAIFHDGYVYTTAGYGKGCQLLKISHEDKKFKAEEVYANGKMSNHHGGVVLIDGYIYGFSGRGLICQDFKTGAVKWQESGKGTPANGSLTSAAGHLFCYDERTGNLHIVVASPDGYKETGKIKLPKQTSIRSTSATNRGGIWTHPVVANGKLFLRDQDLLFAFDVKQ